MHRVPPTKATVWREKTPKVRCLSRKKPEILFEGKGQVVGKSASERDF
jgi:hypothetical protein